MAATAGAWVVIGAYLVLDDGWFGTGWGDFGVELNLAAAIASLLVAALGVILRRTLGRGRAPVSRARRG